MPNGGIRRPGEPCIWVSASHIPLGALKGNPRATMPSNSQLRSQFYYFLTSEEFQLSTQFIDTKEKPSSICLIDTRPLPRLRSSLALPIPPPLPEHCRPENGTHPYLTIPACLLRTTDRQPSRMCSRTLFSALSFLPRSAWSGGSLPQRFPMTQRAACSICSDHPCVILRFLNPAPCSSLHRSGYSARLKDLQNIATVGVKRWGMARALCNIFWKKSPHMENAILLKTAMSRSGQQRQSHSLDL